MANNPNQVVGQVRIKVDGKAYPTSGEATMDIGGPAREAVAGDYEAGSFKQSTMPSKTEVTILLKSGVRLSDLRSIDNATVTLETDVGTTWIVRGAYVAEAISFGQDGKAKVVFGGPPAEEML